MSLIIQSWALSADLAAQSLPQHLRARLQEEVGVHQGSAKMSAVGEFFQAPTALARFYEQRGFQPAWVGAAGPLPQVATLMRTLHGADRHGLDPAIYHLGALETLLTALGPDSVSSITPDIQRLSDLELLLTDAFLLYGTHVLRGRLGLEATSEAWAATERTSDVDLTQRLEDALQSNHLEELVADLRPPRSGYNGLLRARARYQELAANGGWPQISAGPKLQRGERDPRIGVLRNRLQITGDLPADGSPGDDSFDGAVEQGLQRFQRRHGLEADGVLGPTTVAALNVSAEARLRQIEVNMERGRWLPGPRSERAILVNIPAFELAVVENDRSVMTMRVVVGRPTRRTPLLSADITYLVLNPHWYVPPNIAVQDKLPLLRKDPGFAARQRFKIFRGGADATIVDPSAIDWSAVSARNFPYRLRQDPGPGNALGRVKFMFPNPFHVYLHDTPSRDLFAKAERAFSSGCIRIEKPLDLAAYLLSGDPAWSHDKILAAIDGKREQTVRLPTSMPVQLVYNTAWMNAEGIVEFRKDLYDRDKNLERRLEETLPPHKTDTKMKIAMQR
jgi:murein L,D-transpeptidase YcbB/YkuD